MCIRSACFDEPAKPLNTKHTPNNPQVASSVVHLLMDFLGDSSTSAALDVVFFVREMCETHPALVPSVLERLRDNFATIRASRVCTCALWVLSEFSGTAEEVGFRVVGAGFRARCAVALWAQQRRLQTACPPKPTAPRNPKPSLPGARRH